MKGIGCLTIIIFTPVIIAVWYGLTTLYPLLFLLLAALVLRHHMLFAITIAVPAGFAAYVSFWPVGLFQYFDVNIDGALAVGLAAIVTGQYVRCHEDDPDVAGTRTFFLGMALYLTTLWLFGILLCVRLFVSFLDLL